MLTRSRFLVAHILLLLALVTNGAGSLWAQSYRISTKLGTQHPIVVLDSVKNLEGLSFTQTISRIEQDHGIRVVRLAAGGGVDTEIEKAYRDIVTVKTETISGEDGEKAIKSPALYIGPYVSGHPFAGEPVMVFVDSEDTAYAKHELVHHLIALGHEGVLKDKVAFVTRLIELDVEMEALYSSVDLTQPFVASYVGQRAEELRIEGYELEVSSLAITYEEEFLVNNLLLSHRRELGLSFLEQARLLIINSDYLQVAKRDLEQHRIKLREIRRDISRSEKEREAVSRLIQKLNEIEQSFEKAADDMRKTYPDLDVLAHQILDEAEPDYHSSDYRTRLGLEGELDLTEEQIKRAYRPLVMKYHPDKRSADPDASEKFEAYTEAFEFLIKEVNGELNLDDFIEEMLRRYGSSAFSNIHNSPPRPAVSYRPGGFTNWTAKAAAASASATVTGSAGLCILYGATDFTNMPFLWFAGVGAFTACLSASDPENSDKSPIEKPIRNGIKSGLIRGAVVMGCATALFGTLEALMR